MDFKQFKLDQKILNKLAQRKITVPTQVQQEVIPKILAEQDVIAQSKTGTGKTFAYLLPLLQLTIKNNAPVLILSPTKELARQIYTELEYLCTNLNIKTALFTGGEDIDRQVNTLKTHPDIMVAVPGRIIKLANMGAVKLPLIKKIVLDEADFLIDLGFLKDLKQIFSLSRNINQLIVLSATLSAKTKKILDIVHTQKYSVRIDSQNVIPSNIENYFFPIENDNMREMILYQLLEHINPYLGIIFARTKETSSYLYQKLKEKNFNISLLNGDLAPSARKRAINDFKKAKVQYLVSTDLASRGLDVDSVTHIINYNLPVNELDYLHRAGRTGRMNENGLVYSICNPLDEGYLKKYASILQFDLQPVSFKKGTIEVDKKYSGVKPRFNLKEIEKQNKIKNKERKKDGKKTRRNR